MQRWRFSVAAQGLKQGNIVVSPLLPFQRKSAALRGFRNNRVTAARSSCHACAQSRPEPAKGAACPTVPTTMSAAERRKPASALSEPRGCRKRRARGRGKPRSSSTARNSTRSSPSMGGRSPRANGATTRWAVFAMWPSSRSSGAPAKCPSTASRNARSSRGGKAPTA